MGYVIVLEGEVHIMHGTGLAHKTVVRAGEGLVLNKGTRVQWVWPGPCKYVPICLPAFSPSPASPGYCGREEATGPMAKTEHSMDHLRKLHATAPSGAVQAADWQRVAAALAAGLLLGAMVGR